MRTLLSCFCLALFVAGCGPAREAAPDVTFKPLAEGQPSVSLKDLKGKVVLLDFWATWCSPCRMTMPEIQSLHNQFGDKGLQVLAISDEPARVVKPYVERNRFTYPFFIDATGEVNQAFDVRSLPTTILLDKDGKVLARISGWSSTVTKDLENAIAKELGG